MSQSFEKSANWDHNPMPGSSFNGLEAEDIDVHCRIKLYGEFLLTDAIKPSYDVQIRPEAGYRIEEFTDKETGETTPITIAAVSAPQIMEVLHQLLQHLGSQGERLINVTFYSVAEYGPERPLEVFFSDIDIPILSTILEEYREVILNDGYAGVSIAAPDESWELLFDEHKLFYLFGDPELATPVLHANGIHLKEDIKFITEAEHIHESVGSIHQQFVSLVELVEEQKNDRNTSY